jgi:hypothetical protein
MIFVNIVFPYFLISRNYKAFKSSSVLCIMLMGLFVWIELLVFIFLGLHIRNEARIEKMSII